MPGGTRLKCLECEQVNSPGLCVQQSIDKFHIARVHAVIVLLHKKGWKLQREQTKSEIRRESKPL